MVTPLAAGLDAIDPALADALAPIYAGLSGWAPGTVADPEQRARNLLYVPALIDLLQLPIDPYVPLVIFDRLQVSAGGAHSGPLSHRDESLRGTANTLDDLDAFGAIRGDGYVLAWLRASATITAERS